jgi:hypothetical protein
MGIPRPIQEFREGIDLGRKARQLFTEFRLNGIDPNQAEKPGSQYYNRTQEVRIPLTLFLYL